MEYEVRLNKLRRHVQYRGKGLIIIIIIIIIIPSFVMCSYPIQCGSIARITYSQLVSLYKNIIYIYEVLDEGSFDESYL